MKLFTTAIFTGMLVFGTAACAKEEPKKTIVTAAPAAPTSAVEAPKTKKVCVDQQGKDGKPIMDPKTNKPKQNCKEVKVHKKHEGTEVPVKK